MIILKDISDLEGVMKLKKVRNNWQILLFDLIYLYFSTI